ncbi:heavy-metal-associated domain-containing protein [Pseudarthrobacter sp. N5]|uniref:heavy-metal-associated domain-containing protein n=1 Tax=Pseudarthrobacter sp. N5 TaxID=3418416 RepID=UPI003CEFB3E5
MDTLVLRVNGMSCTGCEHRIGTALRRVDGVRDVSANHTTGRVEVRIGPELADRGVITQWITAAGYVVVTEGTQ